MIVMKEMYSCPPNNYYKYKITENACSGRKPFFLLAIDTTNKNPRRSSFY